MRAETPLREKKGLVWRSGRNQSARTIPKNKRPIGAVPQTADKKHGKRIAHTLQFAATAAAEWNVKIIPEPGIERNMPTAPELRDVARKVGDVEIAPQFDAEQLRASYGDAGVARETAVDLDREEEYSGQDRKTARPGVPQ